MFNSAHAFNQDVSFDTANVNNVRLYLCCPTWWDTRFSFPIHTQPSTDEFGVCPYTCLQWTSKFQYGQGYKCETICLLSPFWWETRISFPISSHLIIRCMPCSGILRPSINPYHHLIPPRLWRWVYFLVSSPIESILISISYPICY